MEKTSSNRIFNSAAFVILGCFIVAILIFKLVLGDPSNFMNNDPNNAPLPGNMLGTVYKGGFVVPMILTLLLTVLVLSVERWIAISKANGKKNLTKFVAEIKALLDKGQIKEAQAICEKQKGSVASVIFSSLNKYLEMEQNTELSKEQKLAAIQKELEEATSLEVPTLEQNLPVLATLTTLGTLMGLFGTVLGMIRSFASLSSAGGTDSMALSTGISEALVNTAFGIATGACALIAYNYYTSRIDKLTFCIDEVGFSIVQSYAATH
ncbi:MAG: MotA/TolQ/ExbB proton channel family protein [Bacteroidetes bacterium]|nr:MotA/TolQ/ExbB proton channel family protein [Bacteroidota bacterium]